MSNSVNLSLDVTKTGIQNPLIKVRQGDGGFETLRTTVTANGEPMDLQGWTITFMGTTAGNHKIVDGNVTLVEAPNGIFDYTPSKAWGMDIGDFKIAYFKFVKGDGSASSANFRVNVIEAVDLTQEEAQNYISVVDTTIAEINQHLTNSLANVTQSISDANTNANTVASNVNTLGDRVDDYNNKLAAIKVGGRNLLNGTQKFQGGWGNSSSWQTSGETYTGLSVMYRSVAWNGLGQYYNAKPNTTYTFSFYAKASEAGNSMAIFTLDREYWNDPVVSIPMYTNRAITTDWKRYSITFTTKSGGSIFPSVSSNADGMTIYIAGYKLEEGNVPTDWTPAPEDAPSNDAQLVHKTGTETISGDKTFTSPINGQLSGNAATATKWQVARTLALTGDVAGSVSVDGSDNISIATTGANLVHKTGNETIYGDKTFTGKVAVSGTLDAAQKVYTRTIGTTNDLQVVYTRVGNVVTGRFVAKTTGTFTLSGNDGYKSTSGYPVNVIALNVDAFFTTDNKFTTKTAGEGNFMFITSDPLPAN